MISMKGFAMFRTSDKYVQPVQARKSLSSPPSKAQASIQEEIEVDYSARASLSSIHEDIQLSENNRDRASTFYKNSNVHSGFFPRPNVGLTTPIVPAEISIPHSVQDRYEDAWDDPLAHSYQTNKFYLIENNLRQILASNYQNAGVSLDALSIDVYMLSLADANTLVQKIQQLAPSIKHLNATAQETKINELIRAEVANYMQSLQINSPKV